jgi:hypothetical protein
MAVIFCSLSNREDVIGLEKSNSLAILKSINGKAHKKINKVRKVGMLIFPSLRSLFLNLCD